MRRAMAISLGLGTLLLWPAGALHAQGNLRGLGDAVKKGASDAAKKEVDEAVGVPGVADKAADPKAAGRAAADDTKRDASGRVEGATDDAVKGALGGEE